MESEKRNVWNPKEEGGKESWTNNNNSRTRRKVAHPPHRHVSPLPSLN